MDAKKIIVYDKAEWHFEYFEKNNESTDRAYIHIAMLLYWTIQRGLFSDNFLSDQGKQALDNVRKKKIKASVFLKDYMDGCLLSQDFTDEANEFLQAYYEKYYYRDLLDDCAYEIKDTWDNYAWLASLLDSRLAEWQKTKVFKAEPALNTPKPVGFGKPTKAKLFLLIAIIIFLFLSCYWFAKVMYNL